MDRAFALQVVYQGLIHSILYMSLSLPGVITECRDKSNALVLPGVAQNQEGGKEKQYQYKPYDKVNSHNPEEMMTNFNVPRSHRTEISLAEPPWC